jgi:DNA-directed RNA polymerase specialized sigma24 family protein
MKIREWVERRRELGSMKQLAHRLGVPYSTINNALHRARVRGTPYINVRQRRDPA